MMADAGVVVLVSLISPCAAERAGVRAAEGDLPNLSGVDSAYEAPAEPEVHIRTIEVAADQAAEQIVGHLYRSGLRA